MRALRHAIRHHAINSDRRKDESERRERAQQGHIEPLWRDRAANQLFHRTQPSDRHGCVEPAHLAADRRAERQRIALCSQDEARVLHNFLRPFGGLSDWNEYGRFGWTAQAALLRIIDYADDA